MPEVNELRCPTCGDALAASPCADHLALCLSCSAGHRFFVIPESPPAVETPTAASMQLPRLSGKSPEVVAAFWLSDDEARSLLNEQLAELLRAIIENRRVPNEPSFSRCPLCGDALCEYEQPDIWVQGLRCSNSHSWASRGSRLYGIAGGTRFTLHAELSDMTVAQLIAGWLQGNRALDSQLHDSVRRVLESWPLFGKSAT
jgi:hypothetical protein